MRWITHDQSKIKRGLKGLPEGDSFYVDEKGSQAIVNGTLYIDGKPAEKGLHKIVVGDNEIEINIDLKGKIKERKVKRLGKYDNKTNNPGTPGLIDNGNGGSSNQ